MTARCYYEILEVERTAGDGELKSAFRKLAMQHHPDRNPGDKDAESRFKELNEAYSILSDPQKRAAYDRFGHAGVNGQGPGGGQPFGDVHDIFNEVFGDVFGEMFNAGRRSSGPQRGQDLRYDLEITLEQAYGGAIMLWDCEDTHVLENDIQHQMNGLLTYSCRRLTVRRNVASYNSGYGIHLCGTSDSLFEQNWADYCCRFEPRGNAIGEKDEKKPDFRYGHMGADATGFLIIHASCRNVFRQNLARMGGENMIGLAKAARAEAGVELGGTYDIEVKLDAGERTVEIPADLSAALAASPLTSELFGKLAPSHRKEHVRWVTEAKKDTTRATRIAMVVAGRTG